MNLGQQAFFPNCVKGKRSELKNESNACIGSGNKVGHWYVAHYSKCAITKYYCYIHKSLLFNLRIVQLNAMQIISI